MRNDMNSTWQKCRGKGTLLGCYMLQQKSLLEMFFRETAATDSFNEMRMLRWAHNADT